MSLRCSLSTSGSDNNSLAFHLALSFHNLRRTTRPSSPYPKFFSFSLSTLELFFLVLPLFSSLSSAFGRAMASSSSLAILRKVDHSLLTRLVKILRTKVLDEKFRISSLITKQFLRADVETDSASLQQVVGVLRTKLHGR